MYALDWEDFVGHGVSFSFHLHVVLLRTLTQLSENIILDSIGIVNIKSENKFETRRKTFRLKGPD